MSSSGGGISSYIGGKAAVVIAVVIAATGAAVVPAVTGSADPCAGFDFCDEFSGSSVDTSPWNVINGHNDESNSEPGCALPANVTETGGNLVETIKKQTGTTCPSGTSPVNYTTGVVQFKTYSFTFGTVEVRAKVAGSGGSWPAIWMLGRQCQYPDYLHVPFSERTAPDGSGSCSWPNTGSQEIDIAEFFSPSWTNLTSSIWCSGPSHATDSKTITDASTNFHTYKMVWTSTSVALSVDGGAPYATFTSADCRIPQEPMFLIIDSSLGGGGGGTITDGSLPGTTSVDYVHVTEG